MRRLQVAAAQLPPPWDSDDTVFHTENAVIMLDGATAFVPVSVTPSTYAETLGRELHAHLTCRPVAELRGVLAAAIETTAHRLTLTPGASPSSTVAIVRRIDDVVDILILGDILVVTPDATFTDDRLDQLGLTPRHQYRERLARGHGYDETHRQLLRDLQRQQAARRNRHDGYWIAEADPGAARHALCYQLPVRQVPWAVLATDGAYKPMQHLELADWPQIATMTQHELHALLFQCHRWEADSDPEGQKLPRAKIHDDKTIATVTTP